MFRILFALGLCLLLYQKSAVADDQTVIVGCPGDGAQVELISGKRSKAIGSFAFNGETEAQIQQKCSEMSSPFNAEIAEMLSEALDDAKRKCRNASGTVSNSLICLPGCRTNIAVINCISVGGTSDPSSTQVIASVLGGIVKCRLQVTAKVMEGISINCSENMPTSGPTTTFRLESE